MTGTRTSLRIAPLLAAALLAAAPAAWAGEPTNQIKGVVDRVISILRDASLLAPEKKDERRTKLRAAIATEFDFEEMAKSALAAHWHNRTPAERKEFVELFGRMIERTYIGKIELYTNEIIRYVKEEMTEADRATVDTIVTTKAGQEIPIRYSMLRQGKAWKAYDVTIEGNRLVRNYRDQFQSIIRRSSYEDLVKTLRAKRDEG
ncbi:MAG: ABC transporter substrate-binding protein [Nitrospinota bacterium]